MTTREGLLRKSHKGAPFAKSSNERWFLSEGFHVSYYTDESKKKLTGKFDLRNVVVLRKANEPGIKDGLTLILSESKAGRPKKTVTVSFDTQPDDAAEWRRLWSSAVQIDVLQDEALKQQRDPYLANLFDQEFCTQAGLPSTNSFPVLQAALILSPRVPPTSEALAKSKISSSLSLAALVLPDQAPTVSAEPDSISAAPTKTFSPAPIQPLPIPGPAAMHESNSPSHAPGGDEVQVPAAEAMADEDVEDEVMVVTVPDGVMPGDKLKVTAPDGFKILITVPDGATPGAQLEFSLPKAPAAPAQASKAQALNTQAPAALPPHAPTPTVEALSVEDGAAIRMQSAIRGHNTRFQQQEDRRLDWLKYHLSHDNFDKAQELVCTAEEQNTLKETKHAWLITEWIKYHVSCGDYAAARDLGWNGKNPPGPPTCKCCAPPIARLDKPAVFELTESDPTPNTVEVTRKATQAAVLMQSAIRGHSTRYAMQEDARLEWFNYYISADVGAWDKAAELVCTAEEAHLVELAKTEAERVRQVSAAVAHGELQLARTLGWDGLHPSATVSEKKCCFSMCRATAAVEPPKPKVELTLPGETSRYRFVMAIKEYDWEKAETLAESDQDREDVKDSKARVDHMHYNMKAGNKELAFEYAITKKERQEIEDFKLTSTSAAAV